LLSNSANNPQKDEVRLRRDTVKMLVLAIQFSRTKNARNRIQVGCGGLGSRSCCGSTALQEEWAEGSRAAKACDPRIGALSKQKTETGMTQEVKLFNEPCTLRSNVWAERDVEKPVIN